MVSAAVILAAGASQRMGRPKQLLPVNGQPMLARVIDAVLAAGLDQIIVVLGASADEIRPVIAGKPVTVVVNHAWREGIASSLRAGLALVSPEAEAALFVPADMPRLAPAPIQAIIRRFQDRHKPIVIPLCNGQRGNPVLFARPLFAELLSLRGDQGGRVLFASHAGDMDMVETGDNGILLDVDTPDQYSQVGSEP